jgi:hypothetical protein
MHGCVQRINHARVDAKREDNRDIRDGEIVTACEAACPAIAIVFGNLNDKNSRVSRLKAQQRNYGVLEDLNTRPRTSHLPCCAAESGSSLPRWASPERLDTDGPSTRFPVVLQAAAAGHRTRPHVRINHEQDLVDRPDEVPAAGLDRHDGHRVHVREHPAGVGLLPVLERHRDLGQ